MTKVTGLLTGQTITLDELVPEREGKRVHVLVEAADDDTAADSNRAAAWREWIERGPQGPIEEAGDTDFP